MAGKNESTHEKGDRAWRRWIRFLERCGMGTDPFLDSLPRVNERVLVGRSFVVEYRVSSFDPEGRIIARRPVPMVSATVRDAIGSLASAFRKYGRLSPFHLEGDGHESGGSLHYRIEDLVQGFENVDLQVKKQKALSPLFLRDLNSFVKDKSLRWKVTSDLIIGSFFFAMRACEFCRTEVQGRTERLELQDLEFRDSHHRILPQTKRDLEERARLITIRFRNQKNGYKGEKRTMNMSGDNILCPVKVWARIVQRIRVKREDPAVDLAGVNEFIESGRIKEISSKQVLELLRWSCDEHEGEQRYGLRSSEIGTRSIRSGAVMSLALQKGASDRKIMMLGRWNSDAFLEYIRPQVLVTTGDTARLMTQTASFRDVSDCDWNIARTNKPSHFGAAHRKEE